MVKPLTAEFNRTQEEYRIPGSAGLDENVYAYYTCDIYSHNYTYSFEPEAEFSAVLACADKIRN